MNILHLTVEFGGLIAVVLSPLWLLVLLGAGRPSRELEI